MDRRRERCWVAFRGTNDIDSWFQNLDFQLIQVPGPPGKVHFGFATQLVAALPVINAYVRMN